MSIHEYNQQLRRQWLEASAELSAARERGDDAAASAAVERRARIGNDFVAANRKLAMDGAKDFLRVAHGEDLHDHEQAALLGMWEAFVGTDPDAVGAVEVTDDGAVHSMSGWNPDKGTFGNYSRSFITGQTRRSVRRQEVTFAHMSYTAWSQKPAVDRARRELVEELGRTPTFAQVAQRAGVTVETVRIVSSPPPASLSTPMGEDGGMTLGDRIADLTVDESSLGDVDVAEEVLVSSADDMKVLDLFTVLLRRGITGRPELSVVETADRLCVGRGLVNIGYKRATGTLERKAAQLLVNN